MLEKICCQFSESSSGTPTTRSQRVLGSKRWTWFLIQLTRCKCCTYHLWASSASGSHTQSGMPMSKAILCTTSQTEASIAREANERALEA